MHRETVWSDFFYFFIGILASVGHRTTGGRADSEEPQDNDFSNSAH